MMYCCCMMSGSDRTLEVRCPPSLHHAVESSERMTKVSPDRSCPAGMLMCTRFRSTFSPPTCTALSSSSPRTHHRTHVPLPATHAAACYVAHLCNAWGRLYRMVSSPRCGSGTVSAQMNYSGSLAGAREEGCIRTMMSCMSGSSPGKKAESRASLLPSTGVVSAGQISCREPQALRNLHMHLAPPEMPRIACMQYLSLPSSPGSPPAL